MNQIKLAVLTFLSMLGLVATSAHAEIPAVVGTALAAVQTDATALQAIVIPIVVAVLGLSLVITLIKRFGSKI